ncbi:MAG: hypothetical protein BWY94_02243 [Actinobacteria bacterium ADurb.BinA094]|nr:MAG: hypothetical protein BWY94_02243 [Actinobacteria bacterium ADurb.BinA094]
MTSIPSAWAWATSSRELMPQSTVISSLTPAAASSSTAVAETPYPSLKRFGRRQRTSAPSSVNRLTRRKVAVMPSAS